MINYKKLAVEIHANAVEKKFWDGEPNLHQFISQINTEVGEFVDAVRDPFNNARIGEYEMELVEMSAVNGGYEKMRNSFEECIKDSPEDEMADVFIWLLGFAEGIGVTIEHDNMRKSDRVLSIGLEEGNLFIMVNRLSEFIIKIGLPFMLWKYPDCKTNHDNIANCLFAVEFICEYMDINLAYHVEQKMAYNIGRPPLHGKLF